MSAGPPRASPDPVGGHCALTSESYSKLNSYPLSGLLQSALVHTLGMVTGVSDVLQGPLSLTEKLAELNMRGCPGRQQVHTNPSRSFLWEPSQDMDRHLQSGHTATPCHCSPSSPSALLSRSSELRGAFQPQDLRTVYSCCLAHPALLPGTPSPLLSF